MADDPLADDCDTAAAAAAAREEFAPSHFVEAHDFLATLKILVDSDSKGPAADEEQRLSQDASHKKLVSLLDIYQEQPHLLDPHLEQIISPVIDLLKGQFFKPIDPSAAQLQWRRFSPPESMDEREILPYPHTWFRLLYRLTKVRGYKTIVKFFSHEVTDLEPAVELLELQESGRARGFAWETRYVILIWISLIVMIPFDLKRIDSNVEGGNSLVRRIIDLATRYLSSTGKEREAAGILLGRLLVRPDTVRSHLGGFLEQARITLQGQNNVFTISGHLNAVCQILAFGKREDLLPLVETHLVRCLDTQKSGHLMKTMKSNTLLRKLFVKLAQRIALVTLKPRVVAWRYQRGFRSLQSNLSVPTSETREAALHSQHRMSGDEADEDQEEPAECIDDLIQMLLTGLTDKDSIVRWSAAKGLGRISIRLPSKEWMNDIASCILGLLDDPVSATPDAWHGVCLSLAELARRGCLGLDFLQQVVPVVTKALTYDVRVGTYSVGAHVRDAACYVAWSLARAYDPEDIRPYVHSLATTLVVVAVCDREVNCRRAAAAAFQEHVGRHGVFPHGIDIITAADYWTLGNRTAAYTEISKQMASFEEYRIAIIDHIASTKSHHWDKAIRNLASAALANLVPLDPAHFAEKVLPSLIAETFASEIATRHGTILSVGSIILALDKEKYPLSSDIVKNLAGLVARLKNEEHFVGFGSELMLDASLRAICCLCQCRHVNWQAPSTDLKQSDAVLSQWLDLLISGLERKEAELQDLATEALAEWCKLVVFVGGGDGDLKETQSSFSSSSSSSSSAAWLSSLVMQFMHRILPKDFSTSTYPHEPRRGFASAVGAIPYRAIGDLGLMLQVVEFLIDVAQPPTQKALNDPETRRNCVKSVVRILSDWSPRVSNSAKRLHCDQDDDDDDDDDDKAEKTRQKDGNAMTLSTGDDNHHDSINWTGYLRNILSLLEDYTTDNRGDVGSWVREAAMTAIVDLVELMPKVKDGRDHYDHKRGGLAGVGGGGDDGSRVDGGGVVAACAAAILRQASEKIDRTRCAASRCMQRLLQSASKSTKVEATAAIVVPHWQELSEVFFRDINWSAPADVYPAIIPLLRLREYRQQLLKGLIVSVGSMTESLVRHSYTSLVDYLQTLPTFNEGRHNIADDAFTLTDFGNGLVELIGTLSVGKARLIPPMFVLVEALLESHPIVEALKQTKFGILMCGLTKKEMATTKDVKKMIGGIGVLCALMSLGADVKREALAVLIPLLLHKFPKVRRETAEKLYVAVFTTDGDEGSDRMDRITAILTETQWDILSVDELRAAGTELRQLFRIDG